LLHTSGGGAAADELVGDGRERLVGRAPVPGDVDDQHADQQRDRRAEDPAVVHELAEAVRRQRPGRHDVLVREHHARAEQERHGGAPQTHLEVVVGERRERQHGQQQHDVGAPDDASEVRERELGVGQAEELIEGHRVSSVVGPMHSKIECIYNDIIKLCICQ